MAGDEAAAAGLRVSGQLLGIFGRENPDTWFQQSGIGTPHGAEDIEARIAEREQARRAKNFARADEIRQELAALGVILEDTPSGTTWRRG